MPCNTITSVTLVLKNANLDLLKKALEGLGYLVNKVSHGLQFRKNRGLTTFNYYSFTGEFNAENLESANAIKRAYTSQIVQNQASRFGWKVKSLSANKFQIQKG